jgi:hypothetical protein
MEKRLDRRAAATRSHGPLAVAALGLIAALLLATATLAHPVSDDGPAAEAESLRTALGETTALAQRRIKLPARRLAAELPGEASRLSGLRDPARTVEAQLGVALGELQQMSALAVDPHYLPALIAVGRAHSAATGRDPLTGTTINPEYLGLERELAASATQLEAAAGEGGRLAAAVRQLVRELARSKRRARSLKRAIERSDAREARRERG